MLLFVGEMNDDILEKQETRTMNRINGQTFTSTNIKDSKNRKLFIRLERKIEKKWFKLTVAFREKKKIL